MKRRNSGPSTHNNLTKAPIIDVGNKMPQQKSEVSRTARRQGSARPVRAANTTTTTKLKTASGRALMLDPDIAATVEGMLAEMEREAEIEEAIEEAIEDATEGEIELDRMLDEFGKSRKKLTATKGRAT